MKRILWIIPILAIIVIGLLTKDVVLAKTNEVIYQSPCNTPIKYSIGTIDQEFNLSKEVFTSDVEKAAEIWNTTYGKQLFVYEQTSPFTINLQYDSRQELNTEINQLNTDLEQKDTNLKPELEEYKKKSAALNNQINQLNQEIDTWNNKGGAPPEVYEKLKSDQNRLQQEASEINAKADALSLATQDYNNEVQHLEQKVTNYNTALTTRPEGGLYIFDGKDQKIEIYIYDSRQELLHTITHEMGHALGIDHVNNPQAIMFSRTNSVTQLANEDLAALTEVCKKKNVIVMKFNQFSLVVNQIIKSFTSN